MLLDSLPFLPTWPIRVQGSRAAPVMRKDRRDPRMALHSPTVLRLLHQNQTREARKRQIAEIQTNPEPPDSDCHSIKLGIGES